MSRLMEALAIAGAIGWLLLYWYRARHSAPDPQPRGAVGQVEVRLADEPGSPAAIEVVYNPGGDPQFNTRLTPTEARTLAQWLRIGATSGRSLNTARCNFRLQKP